MKQAAKNKASLVNAAADLFWRNGYDGTSLADIAAAANVPLGNVYYYFKSKSVLATEVGNLIATETEAALSRLDRHYAMPSDRILGLIDLLSESNDIRSQNGCPIARAILEFRNKVPEAAERSASALKVLQVWLEHQFSLLGKDKKVANTLAFDIVSSWQGAIILACADRQASGLDKAMTRLREKMVSAIQRALPLNSRG